MNEFTISDGPQTPKGNFGDLAGRADTKSQTPNKSIHIYLINAI